MYTLQHCGYTSVHILATFLLSVSSMAACLSWSNFRMSYASFCWASAVIPALEPLWLDWMDAAGLGGLCSSHKSQSRDFCFFVRRATWVSSAFLRRCLALPPSLP